MTRIINSNLIITVFFLVFLAGCASIQKRIDIAGIKNIAENIQKDFKPGSKQELEEYIKILSLEGSTKPLFTNQIEKGPLDKWKINHPLGKELIMEKISFPSLIQHEKGGDKAIFYVYRHGELKGSDVILWVPGMAVSDFAFRFIKHFFFEELKRDYNIVFYVPPYHMERTEDGKKNGEGLFTADTAKNIDTTLNSVRELRTISEYLIREGVRSISGWGGSIGASMLLLTSRMVKLDHLCIMIPVINWETIIFDNPYMKDVLYKMQENGFSENLLKNAYGIINPINYQLDVNPQRVHIMYAEYDQLTPSTVIIDYAEARGISKIVSYRRSHATILLTKQLYKDCGIFLDSLR